jgi:hypothetical protein
MVKLTVLNIECNQLSRFVHPTSPIKPLLVVSICTKAKAMITQNT